MIDFFVEPLQYSFMVRGLLAAIFVGIVCAVIGNYVVLRGMAFFGDALAHAILPGVAVGYIVGEGAKAPLFWWALITAVLSAIGIGVITRSTRIREDTAIGIIFAGMFALGIALISTTNNYAVDLTHFLFGNVLGVGPIDLLVTAIFGGFVLIMIIAFYKEFLVMSFDPILASTLRLPTRLLHYLLLVLIAISIVVALQTVGVALMLAMLVTPAATAYLLTKRLPIMMTLSALFAASSGVIGLYASYYLGIASGAAIVLACTSIFFLVWSIQTIRQRFYSSKIAQDSTLA